MSNDRKLEPAGWRSDDAYGDDALPQFVHDLEWVDECGDDDLKSAEWESLVSVSDIIRRMKEMEDGRHPKDAWKQLKREMNDIESD